MNLLRDEPQNEIDPIDHRIQKEFNITIMLIEHDIKLSYGSNERIYVLEWSTVPPWVNQDHKPA